MQPDSQVVALLRGEILQIISGTFFIVLGIVAFLIAVIRRRSDVGVLVWIGTWSGLFGANDLAKSDAVAAALPIALHPALPVIIAIAAYLLVVVGTLSFLGLSQGKLRSVLWVLIAGDLLVAAAGLATFFVTGVGDAFTAYNNVLAVVTLAILVIVVCVPSLSRKYMVVAGHGVLTAGTAVFAAQALHANLASVARWPNPAMLSSAGFAVLLLSFGYTAMEMLVGNENRLIAIDKELEIARELQFSILPGSAPEIAGLRIAAVYEPMTAVAGDFYEFVKIDDKHIGFLVADVSGHGVPAALIASMIKVAVQSVNGCASHPAEVMRRLGSVLSSHLRGQFVTAAYLWIDLEARVACYSAAGHPPLLHWGALDATLTRVESNGLLYGVMPDCEYPACEISLVSGDRLLLYTDGVTEPENAAGEAFGDRRLEQIVREKCSADSNELSSHLLAGVRNWQAASSAQDDITLIVIDVV